MPYPLPDSPLGTTTPRIRILPPIGCPGSEQWVLPMDLPGWLELGYRRGPVPADELELAWLPADPRWNEPIAAVPIELLIQPRLPISAPLQVSWGDGSSETIPWPATARQAPRLRHLYSERADVTVQVQIGLRIASLRVALLGCPVPPRQLLQQRDGGGAPATSVQPLIPTGGISGEPFDGRHAVIWRLRLHPSGGLGLLPDPASGEPALAVVQESGVGRRATRWYSGDGPPPTGAEAPLQPTPVVGDFYLDRLSGQVFELAG